MTKLQRGKSVREEMKLCQFIYDLNSVEIIHYIKHAMQPVIPKDALISCWCSLKQPNLVPTGDTTQYTTF